MSIATLTAGEVAAKIADRFLVGTVKADHYVSNDGSTPNQFVFRGNLANNRPATSFVMVKDGLMHFGLRVPGNGDLGRMLMVLVEDATEERINRYLDILEDKHKEALKAL